MDQFPQNDYDIEHYLEDISDDVGFTDIESDGDDAPIYTTNCDRIFQDQLALSGCEPQTQAIDADEEQDLEIVPPDDQPSQTTKCPVQDDLFGLTVAQPSTSANDEPKKRRTTARQIQKDGQLLSGSPNENQPQPSTSVVNCGNKSDTKEKGDDKKIKEGK